MIRCSRYARNKQKTFGLSLYMIFRCVGGDPRRQVIPPPGITRMALIDAQWLPLSSTVIRNLTYIPVPEPYPSDYDNPEKSEMGYTWKSWKILVILVGWRNANDVVRSAFELAIQRSHKRHFSSNRLEDIVEKPRKSEKVGIPEKSHKNFSQICYDLEFAPSTRISKANKVVWATNCSLGATLCYSGKSRKNPENPENPVVFPRNPENGSELRDHRPTVFHCVPDCVSMPNLSRIGPAV